MIAGPRDFDVTCPAPAGETSRACAVYGTSKLERATVKEDVLARRDQRDHLGWAIA